MLGLLNMFDRSRKSRYNRIGICYGEIFIFACGVFNFCCNQEAYTAKLVYQQGEQV